MGLGSYDHRRASRCFLLITLGLLFFSFQPRSVLAAPDWVEEAIAAAEGLDPGEDAETFLLFYSSDVAVSEKGHAKRQVRVVSKVLQTLSNGIYVSALNTAQHEVKGMKGWRIDSFGKTHKLDKNDIVEVDPSQTSGYYSEGRLMRAAFPEVEIGDIAAFEYTVHEKRNGEGLYQRCVFQSGAPVAHCVLQITTPVGWKVHQTGRNRGPINYVVEGNRHKWEAGFMPLHPDEPYMPPSERLTRDVLVNCYDPQGRRATNFSDWSRSSNWAWQLHRERALLSQDLQGAVDGIVRSLSSPEKKLEAIAKYVRDDIRYVAVEIGIGRFQPRTAGETWQNKYGDCKDKVTLMRAMLDAAGVPSQPVLARSGGFVDTTLPSPFQFNHVIIGVPISVLPSYAENNKARIDDYLYFDPTDESTFLGLIPGSLQGTTVLRLDDDGYELVQLPKRIPDDRHRTFHVEGVINPGNGVTAAVRLVDHGILAAEVGHWREQTPVKDQLDVIQSDLSEIMRDPVVKDYTFGRNSDSAWETYTFMADNYLTASGDMMLLKLDPLHEDRKNRLKKKAERHYPIYFGKARTIVTNVTWEIPARYDLSDAPDSSLVENGFGAIVTSLSSNSRVITFRTEETYSGVQLEPEEYSKARKFERARNKARSALAFLKSK